MSLLVGVDLGGTLIRAAVARPQEGHEPPVRLPTPAAAGPTAVLDAVADAVRRATGGRAPDGLAIGLPGPLDPVRGIVFGAPNLPGWENLPVAEELRARLKCPVAVQNDANLAGYAEWRFGAGRGTQEFAFVTVSTGVGGALVLGGELYSGAAGTAGEIGHNPVTRRGPKCGQGHVGCLEAVASGTAIARRARAALAAGRPTSIAATPATVTAADVVEAARRGDALAHRLLDEAGHALGRALGGLVNLISPEVIVIGGGVSQAGELLLAPTRRGMGEMAFPAPLDRCRLTLAALGTDAGLVGATAWARRCFGSGPGEAGPAGAG